ncbi:hypothetical protein [Vibrio coralliilyticus]|uniref:hypothetical protein n=1 Tax=Vibrio coralliilyticus TaxID=190893 RepID=UPI00035DF376|nr:hypothetical protein [Vibrio coralliilyticus]
MASLTIELKNFNGKEPFISNNAPSIQKCSLARDNQTFRLIDFNESNTCFYLPYIDRAVSVIKVPAMPTTAISIITDSMDGCNLLLKQCENSYYLLHDNYTMNIAEDDEPLADLYDDDDTYFLKGCSFSNIEQRMLENNVCMGFFVPENKSFKGLKLLMQRGMYRDHTIPILSYEKGMWSLGEY